MVKMLDLVGLPKNTNGFRTTHTCELCGFEPKTKNKYREKQDHLVMKHFKEKIDKIFPHCRPYTCPSQGCEFTGKDKQALLRHYTGKHGILEQFLREALSEKGINYNPLDMPYKTKRKNSTEKKAKAAATATPVFLQTTTATPQTPTTPGAPQAFELKPLDPKALLPSVPLSSESLSGQLMVTSSLPPIKASKTNNEELRREVDALMASLQPHDPMETTTTTITPVSSAAAATTLSQHSQLSQQHHQAPLVVALPQVPALNLVSSDGSSGAIIKEIRMNPSGPLGHISLPTVPLDPHTTSVSMSSSSSSSINQPQMSPMPRLMTPPGGASISSDTNQSTSGNSLPGLGSLILPQHPVPIQQQQQLATPDDSNSQKQNGPLPSLISNGRIIKTTTLLRRSPPPQTTPSLKMSSHQQLMPELIMHPQSSQSNISLQNGGRLPSVMTIQQGSGGVKGGHMQVNNKGQIPMAVHHHGHGHDALGPRNSVASDPGSSTPPSSIAMDDPSEMNAEQNTVVLENEEVMWSAPMDGPAVVVEVADTVPVAYIDQNGQAVNGHHPGNHHMGTAQVVNNQYTTQLDNMEYDYLYTNNVVTTNAGAVNTVSVGNVGVTVNDNLICPTTVRQRQLDFCML